MSIAALDWAFAASVTGPAKAVLLVLANRANEADESWPSQDRIAFEAGWNLRTVRNSLKKLISSHLIDDLGRKAGRLTTTFRLLVEAATRQQIPGDTRQEIPGHPALDSGSPGISFRSTRQEIPPNPKEPKEGKEGKDLILSEIPLPPAFELLPPAAEHRLPTANILDAWNAMAAKTGLPKAAKLTPDRLRHLNARIKEHGADAVITAIANIGASSFCRGETGGAGWRADFDFLLQPTSFVRALEGRYADRVPSSGGTGPKFVTTDWGTKAKLGGVSV